MQRTPDHSEGEEGEQGAFADDEDEPTCKTHLSRREVLAWAEDIVRQQDEAEDTLHQEGAAPGDV